MNEKPKAKRRLMLDRETIRYLLSRELESVRARGIVVPMTVTENSCPPCEDFQEV
jgi:hypothetical protein